MSMYGDSRRSIAAWLEAEAPDRAPSPLIEASRERIATTRQRRAWWLRGSPGINAFARVGLAVVAVAVIGVVGLTIWRVPTVGPAAGLGIFEPVAGQIVFNNGADLVGVDPSAPADPVTLVRLATGANIPLGWSRHGTELLVRRGPPWSFTSTSDAKLFVLHADGSETLVTERPFRHAAISPDGSRVVFSDIGALYAVDAGGGPAEVLAESRMGYMEEMAFSPDGTQIAYGDGFGDNNQTVWLMDANGGNAHQIAAQDCACHVEGLAWSPAGDRIALALEGTIYTFAPDGSDFRAVISGGKDPNWSPDGSQIAYTTTCEKDPNGCGLEIADANGSNVREFSRAAGLGRSGPWHPGALDTGAGG